MTVWPGEAEISAGDIVGVVKPEPETVVVGMVVELEAIVEVEDTVDVEATVEVDTVVDGSVVVMRLVVLVVEADVAPPTETKSAADIA